MKWNTLQSMQHFKWNVTWFLYASSTDWRRQWMRYKKLSLWIYFFIFMILLNVWYLHIGFDGAHTHTLTHTQRERDACTGMSYTKMIKEAGKKLLIRITCGRLSFSYFSLSIPLSSKVGVQIKADANGRGSWHVSDLIENHWRWFSSRWAILMRCLFNISKPSMSSLKWDGSHSIVRLFALHVKNVWCARVDERIECIESETIPK